MTSRSSQRKRVLSGMRSTGKLHLGNYVGALDNWVRMQDQYECFFFVADWHALDDRLRRHLARSKRTRLKCCWIGWPPGSIPERCTMFIQSHVPQHAELHLLFSMITPLGWLERVPTYKEQRGKYYGKRFEHLWVSWLPGAAGRGHSDLQRRFCSGGRRSGAACRAYPRRSRAASIMFYYPQRRLVFPEPQAFVDSGRKTARHRRPQNVEVLRQYHPAYRSRAGGAAEAQDHGDRSGADPAHRSGQSGRLSCGRSAQNFQQPVRLSPKWMRAAVRRASAVSNARAGRRTHW